MRHYIGIDVGGSHLSASPILQKDDSFTLRGITHRQINSRATAREILADLLVEVEAALSVINTKKISGLVLSIPGPFLYDKGVSKISGVRKYESLFGMDLRATLQSVLQNKGIACDRIYFQNDAESFLLGAAERLSLGDQNVLAVTLGTGLGSASIWNGELHQGLPGKGYLYNTAFLDGDAEDYFSTRWFLKKAAKEGIAGAENLNGVKELLNRYDQNPAVREICRQFSENLAGFLNELFGQAQPEALILGGNIMKSFHCFRDDFEKNLEYDGSVNYMGETSGCAVLGAALGMNRQSWKKKQIRKTKSPVLPLKKETASDGYDIYPSFPLRDGHIHTGFASLAGFINELPGNQLVIDGAVGTLWSEFVPELNRELSKKQLVNWYSAESALKTEREIDDMLNESLGDDEVFGTLYDGDLSSFFHGGILKKIEAASSGLSVLYGTGAALAGWDAPIIYIDVPKNEIQFRSRAASITNLGKTEADDPKKMYKRFYFADWPVCNHHKKELLPYISAIVDGQRTESISWMPGADFRTGLDEMAKSTIRVRPWFEPGVWGGHWMQDKFRGLVQDEKNYAWSFELIAPENGILFEKSGLLLETGFEWLMYQNNHAVLGVDAGIYNDFFPVRFDYLDTMDGENLSLQCHPVKKYMKENFGEMITQDETYYITDAKPGARVFLGFQDNIDPDEFHAALQQCEENGTELEVENYVQSFPSSKHQLYLIPAGTVHCSGRDNLVLEISNTPYIYTFKMYDWQRLGLDGKPRPINIARAMENLNFERKGVRVTEELISKPVVISSSEEGDIVELPTHSTHIYRVQRLEIKQTMEFSTGNKVHILNVVEGDKVEITTGKRKLVVHFAETCIIPAAADSYRIENLGSTSVKIVKAMLK